MHSVIVMLFGETVLYDYVAVFSERLEALSMKDLLRKRPLKMRGDAAAKESHSTRKTY